MGIRGMNHAVLYVRDAQRSASFYQDVLGFSTVTEVASGVFLRAPDSTNDHDIAFFSIGDQAGASTAGRSTVGLYHLAWEVGTLAELAEVGAQLESVGSLVGASDHGGTKSFYAKDPDGLEFEVCWVVPAGLLPANLQMGVFPLDLEREIERFGATTPGGR